jgi:RecB family exonuclease
MPPIRQRTVVVDGPLAFRMRRLQAAREGEVGLAITTLPLLAARLAGGFSRPAQPPELEPAIRTALEQGAFAELEHMPALPGTARAALWTLRKAWNADLSLSDLAVGSARIADLALLESRVHAVLSAGVLTPRRLRDAALGHLRHAPNTLGSVELDRVMSVAPVWRPFIDALAGIVELTWRTPGAADRTWFRGTLVEQAPVPGVPAEIVSCGNPRAEAIESLRWLRELLASGRARPEEVAIAAPATELWDEEFLVLAVSAGLPLHFSHGVPALSTREGQACAALADVLLNGLSQDRMRRLLGHAAGRVPAVKDLRRDWAAGLRPEAGLFEIDHWRRALDEAAARRPEGPDPKPVLIPVIELLAQGTAAVAQAGDALLAPEARGIWIEALRSAPAAALEFSLQRARVPDGRDPGNSVVWCPASHLAGAPRPRVRLLGLTSRSWPRANAEDPLLPDHILPRRQLDPDPVTARDRDIFRIIVGSAAGGCVLSFSRRDAQEKVLAPSPLLRGFAAATLLRRERTPQHAFSEADRLTVRPEEAAATPAIAAAARCAANWRRGSVTAHDGRIRRGHPVIRQAVLEIQSSTSLRRMLRDPLGFVWRYALGWRPAEPDAQPLDLDARTRGELVHELLRRTVDALEPSPGFARADSHEIEDALAAAVNATKGQWPLARPTPPLLLWEHTLDWAAALALRALTLDPPLQGGTRSWTEVPFGRGGAEADTALPWDSNPPVLIPGTAVRIRGAIDRLEVTAAREGVRLSDYKTGAEPRNAAQIELSGGAELQRVLYTLAVRQLLPDVPRIVARLIYLGGERPNAYRLADVDQAVTDIAAHVAAASTVLEEGVALPGPDARESWNEFRLALPAGLPTYWQIKQAAFAQAFGRFTRVWSAR